MLEKAENPIDEMQRIDKITSRIIACLIRKNVALTAKTLKSLIRVRNQDLYKTLDYLCRKKTLQREERWFSRSPFYDLTSLIEPIRNKRKQGNE